MLASPGVLGRVSKEDNAVKSSWFSMCQLRSRSFENCIPVGSRAKKKQGLSTGVLYIQEQLSEALPGALLCHDLKKTRFLQAFSWHSKCFSV